jgi:hypothetical protein
MLSVSSWLLVNTVLGVIITETHSSEEKKANGLRLLSSIYKIIIF